MLQCGWVACLKPTCRRRLPLPLPLPPAAQLPRSHPHPHAPGQRGKAPGAHAGCADGARPCAARAVAAILTSCAYLPPLLERRLSGRSRTPRSIPCISVRRAAAAPAAAPLGQARRRCWPAECALPTGPAPAPLPCRHQPLPNHGAPPLLPQARQWCGWTAVGRAAAAARPPAWRQCGCLPMPSCCPWAPCSLHFLVRGRRHHRQPAVAHDRQPQRHQPRP